jgi:hypothetical protein
MNFRSRIRFHLYEVVMQLRGGVEDEKEKMHRGGEKRYEASFQGKEPGEASMRGLRVSLSAYFATPATTTAGGHHFG